jgi:Zn finger protein HypA/HybF involved in hydrogenase expression
MSPNFQRKIEDFTCGHCRTKVKGTGYTNHCPKCLWSKHVDINPGDRQEVCGGMMEPTGLEMDKNEYVILHTCEKCGQTRKNHAADNDDINALIKLSESLAKRAMF